jgi:prolyl-tRNA editing enzyme YbaK/EbsC (Cys-tRNA(Pro) deacylase)
MMMSLERVKAYLKQWDMDGKVLEFAKSSATVDLAAEAAGVIPARIAKTISFQDGEDGCILIATAGDTKVDNAKFKAKFGVKAKMLKAEQVVEFTGHAIGGVCPFAITNPATKIFTDVSLKRFDTIFPACGSSNSAIELTCDELFKYAQSNEWVDVCKGW